MRTTAMDTLTLFDAVREIGETAAEACAAKAERQGWDARAAAAFILGYLEEHGPTPGEKLVDECSKFHRPHDGRTFGDVFVCRPHDGRAFGAVFRRLKRAKLIEVCGTAPRLKGHGTAGGLVWKLTRE